MKYIRLRLSNKHMSAGQCVPLIVTPNELDATIDRYSSLGYTIKAEMPEGLVTLSSIVGDDE